MSFPGLSPSHLMINSSCWTPEFVPMNMSKWLEKTDFPYESRAPTSTSLRSPTPKSDVVLKEVWKQPGIMSRSFPPSVKSRRANSLRRRNSPKRFLFDWVLLVPTGALVLGTPFLSFFFFFWRIPQLEPLLLFRVLLPHSWTIPSSPSLS